MRLPITESILRGELRPHILQESMTSRLLNELMRKSGQLSRPRQLTELEAKINEVLDELANTRAIYSDEKKTRDAAIHARENNYLVTTNDLTYMGEEIVITDALDTPSLNTPLLRFYSLLIDTEALRTRLAMRHLYNATLDAAFMRSTLKELFLHITRYCEEANEWAERQEVMGLLPPKLTMLYFSLLNTYSPTLHFENEYSFEQGFPDFVYGWKGVYPSAEEEERYNRQHTQWNQPELAPEEPAMRQTASCPSARPQRPKDRADCFIEAANGYNFSEIPHIKALGSNEKTHDLVAMMLDSPGHACAMLEYLQFYEWMKKQKVGIKKKEYFLFCSEQIMGLKGSQAFKNVYISLKKENKNAGKYKAYLYKEQVENEYQQLLNK